MSARLYHLDDYPATLDVLSAVANGRDLAAIGYTPTEHGATIDWDALLGSWLSSTEMASVHIARGVAIAERQGGFPEHVAPVIWSALHRVNGPPD